MIAFPEEMKKKHIWLIFFPYSVYLNFLWQQSEKYPYSDSIIINPHGRYRKLQQALQLGRMWEVLKDPWKSGLSQ